MQELTHAQTLTMPPIMLILPNIDHIIRARPRALPMLFTLNEVALILALSFQDERPLSM
jgi:hypothetical protein